MTEFSIFSHLFKTNVFGKIKMPHGKRRVQLMDTQKISYACQLCDKAYFSEYGLKLHFKQSHADKDMGEGRDDFICPFCDKIFNTKFQIKNHRRLIHQGR